MVRSNPVLARTICFAIALSAAVAHAGKPSDAQAKKAATDWIAAMQFKANFEPAKAVPAIAPDSTIKSIVLVLEDGPDAEGGMVVLDNINLNGNFVGHE